jgi:hypothetical protein
MRTCGINISLIILAALKAYLTLHPLHTTVMMYDECEWHASQYLKRRGPHGHHFGIWPRKAPVVASSILEIALLSLAKIAAAWIRRIETDVYRLRALKTCRRTDEKQKRLRHVQFVICHGFE